MSFLNLWSALAIGAAVVSLLVLLYFLKLRRREQTVSSTLLWRRAVQDLQVNAPFQRLRRNLLLLLQLLVLAAGVLALARPVVQTPLARQKSLVLILDRSASMNTVEADGRTRLELAKEQARRIVRTLNRTQGAWWRWFSTDRQQTRVMLIAMADRAEVLSPFTTNTADLVRVIDAIQPTDAPTHVAEALSLAEAYVLGGWSDEKPIPGQEPSGLVLISDAAFDVPQNVSLRTRRLELIPVGKRQDNVGIVSLRYRRNYERPEKVSLFVQVENFGPQPVRSDISIYVDGVLQKVETVELAAARQPGPQATTAPAPGAPVAPLSGTGQLGGAGPSASLSIDLLLDRAAVVEARLSHEDALATDNRAYAVVPPPRRLSVLTVSKGDFFLERVIRELPLARRVFLTPEQYERAADSELERDGASVYDVVILDGHDTQRLPAGNYLCFGGLPKVEAIRDAGLVEKFPILWWDDAHPVLRDVALEYVFVARGRKFELPKTAEVLAEASHGPVIGYYGQQGRQFLIVGFRIPDSPWWNKVSFPIFVYNALAWLGGAGTGERDAGLRPGQTLTVPAPAGTDELTIIRPDGRRVGVRVDPDRIARFGDTRRVGIYTIEPAPPQRGRVAVNLADPAESRIAPRPPERLGGVAVRTSPGIETRMPEVWRWAVGAALVLLLIEWYVYTRRVMI